MFTFDRVARVSRYLLLIAAGMVPVLPAPAPVPAIRIYAIDTEGGKSTLYVSPSGESMLVDAGYAGNNGRDADRILAAAKAAGIQRIDYLVVTHFHADHMGGVVPLAARIPIGRFCDHGETVDGSAGFAPYAAERAKHPHTVLRAGDTIPIRGLDVRLVAAAGEAIAKPLPGGGQANPLCSSYKALDPDPGENARSLALLITFGKFRVADFGDLYWNQEYELACPVNKVGAVDLYMTTHHGTKTSGLPQLVQSIHPAAAIMNNGAKKGGSVQAWTTIRNSPGLADIWQLHFSNEGGAEHNAPADFLANPVEACEGKWIEVTAKADGAFTIHNSRNGFEKTYRK
ncbi:MAG: MBL fold metallo-hydrolase [Acidobacteriota bacterium]